MYWTINKKTQEPEIYKTLRNVSESVGVPYDSLAYEFSRKKSLSFENESYYIEKSKDANLSIKAYAKKLKDLESDLVKVGSITTMNGFVEIFTKVDE